MKWIGVACALVAAAGAGVASALPPSAGTVGGHVLVNPLSVALLVPSRPVKAGNDFQIRTEVGNAGTTALLGVSVSLVAPGALRLRDPATQVLARVGPGIDRRVHWDACSTTVGSYIVIAHASTGPLTAESTGQLIQITSARRPAC